MRTLITPLLLCAAGVAAAQAPAVRVNQVGFLPMSAKFAVVNDATAERFEIVQAGSTKPIFSGTLSPPSLWPESAETVRIADFSALSAAGDYHVRVGGKALSDRFTIGADVYSKLNMAAIKAFYFNRSGTELLPVHAGAYARPAGHPDDKVLVHASAASGKRPAGTVIASSKGWYDAGDYNKYLPSSGISTYTLLAAFEHFPSVFAGKDLNIPESGNGLPDILDEALWNLEWMLSMQDGADGGVYHKLTNQRFDGMVLPGEAMREPRYVVQKSTAAALNFAATMAAASRVLRPYGQQLPGMSASMLAAAESAWKWAVAHPNAAFRNPADVVTGEYGDAKLEDEFAWAAAELYITTGNGAYYKAMKPEAISATVPAWDDVRGLAWMSLAHHRKRLTPLADQKLIAQRVDGLAASLAKVWAGSAYRVAMQAPDFVWGSNAVVLNQSMMLLQGYQLSGKADYLRAAQSGLDYVLGRNAIGYSFVTGFGTRTPRYPHHRPSEGDKVAEPVPGFVAGGPQPNQQDKAECPVPYPGVLPATAYLDHVCSYASNEVAINWNAPLVYVTAALQQLTPSSTKASMDKPAPTLDTLARQEKLLQFDSFSNATAFELGVKLVEMARKNGQAVAVDITRNGTQLFYHGMDGTTQDHAHWISRKSRLVNRTGRSSFYTHTEVAASGGDIDAIPTLDPREYAAHGGSFPLIVKGAGQVGTITVSGLPGPDDHAMVVSVLKDYLNVKGSL